MATHSSVLAWRIPGTEEPGGLLSMGSHRVGHDWCTLAAAAAAFLGDMVPIETMLVFVFIWKKKEKVKICAQIKKKKKVLNLYHCGEGIFQILRGHKTALWPTVLSHTGLQSQEDVRLPHLHPQSTAILVKTKSSLTRKHPLRMMPSPLRNTSLKSQLLGELQAFGSFFGLLQCLMCPLSPSWESKSSSSRPVEGTRPADGRGQREALPVRTGRWAAATGKHGVWSTHKTSIRQGPSCRRITV